MNITHQSTCSRCKGALPEAINAALCPKCDLYNVKRYTWNSLAEFNQFLNGKQFVMTAISIGDWCEGSGSNIRAFANAIIESPKVIEVKLAGFDDPEELIGISTLIEKLPNCSGIQLSTFTLTEQTAPYLAKIAALPWVRALVVQQARFTSESCQAFVDALIPERFPVLSLEECDIPSMVPIYKLLERANIDTIPYLVDRPLTDEESSAFVNIVKNNQHLKAIYVSNLSHKHSRELAEAIQEGTTATHVTFARCDLVTAIPAIVQVLQTRKSLKKVNLNYCNITLGLLTELCEGLKDIKSTTDQQLWIMERNYTDSLDPIKTLLEDNVQLYGLHLRFGSGPEEWIKVFDSLKKNSSLKEFDFYSIQSNTQMMDVLLDAMKVNTTLKSLCIQTELFDPVLDQFIIEAITQNRLDTFQSYNGILRDLNFEAICDMLKKNFRLKKFAIPSALDTAENIKLFQEMLEENHSLIDCSIMDNSYQLFAPCKERNKLFREEWIALKLDMIVLLHNIARNAETIRELLPIDLWLEIFKQIRHPLSPDNGLENFAKKIFKRYKLY